MVNIDGLITFCASTMVSDTTVNSTMVTILLMIFAIIGVVSIVIPIAAVFNLNPRQLIKVKKKN